VLYFSEKCGGLNGSTQHSGRTPLVLKTKAESLASLGSAKTSPWLGFVWVQPTDHFSRGKYCRIK
jgi:hypothetical protein